MPFPPLVFPLERFADNELARCCRHILAYRIVRAVALPVLGVELYCRIGWITRRAADAGRAYETLFFREKRDVG